MPSDPRTRLATLLLVTLGAAAVLPLCWFISSRTQPPEHTRTDPAMLPKCPDSPNCVCSQDPDRAHATEPLVVPDEVPEADALRHVLDRVSRLPGARVIRVGERYAHLEFRTRVLRFVDDVELLAEPGSRRVQVRSASRLGHSDLGANRRRVEAMRKVIGL